MQWEGPANGRDLRLFGGSGMPTFAHSFEPAGGSPLGATVDLTVQEVEEAGIREVLQTPGAKVGHWGLLGPLLDPTSSDFMFLEPLGQSREVKTAISGLLGRFVARAYASKHLGLTHFAHIRRPPMRLRGARGVLRRVAGATGDMPDWVAWGPGVGLAIVEAKGCHDPAGPSATLQRAYTQANRAEIAAGGLLAPFKRYAIVSRWGFCAPIGWEPMLSVRDPDEEGEGLSEREIRDLELGVVRRHFGELLLSVGEERLARAFFGLAESAVPARDRAMSEEASVTLASARRRTIISSEDTASAGPELVGGYVSAAGVLPAGELTPDELATLSRLGLRPTFIGIETSALQAAIKGDLGYFDPAQTDGDGTAGRLRRGSSGDWIVPLEPDGPRIE